MDTINSCRCCLLRRPDKDLKKPYTRFGITEIYSDMIKECFEIQLTLDNDNMCGICEVCVGRLQDASDFKLLVQRSQKELQAQLEVAVEFQDEPPVKAEMENGMSDDDMEDILSEPAVEADMDDVKIDPEHLLIGSNETTLDSCKQELYETSNGENHLAFTTARLECLHEDTAPLICGLSHEMCDREAPPIDTCTLSGGDNSQQDTRENISGVPNKHTFMCDICGKQFANKSQTIKHLKNHMGQQTVPRKIAEKKIYHKDILSQSTASHTGQIMYKCSVCEQQTKSRIGLISHMRVHTKRDFKQKSRPRKLTQTDEKPYTRGYCNRQFRDLSTLRYHEKNMHTKNPMADPNGDNENHCCDICGNQYIDKFNLIRHIQCHTEVKPFACNICQKRFKRNHHLSMHIGVHMGLDPYGCQVCGQRFVKAKSLKLHKLYHKRERPYPCEICHKRFCDKSQLRDHIRVHTGEKPYCCEVCGRKFSRKTNFTTHLKIHMKGYTFSCELCPKFYSTKEGLRQHIRVHTRQK